MNTSGFVRTGLAILVAAGAAACSGGGDSSYGNGPTGPKRSGSAPEVHLTSGLKFAPGTLTVAPGTKVRWVNDASIPHTITPENPNQKGVWSKQTTSSSGNVFEHTFSEAGQTYSYRCDVHNGMTGTIQVSASSDPGY